MILMGPESNCQLEYALQFFQLIYGYIRLDINTITVSGTVSTASQCECCGICG